MGVDVTVSYTPEQRKKAWKNAFAYMYYMILNPNPPVSSWFADGVLVGAFSAPGQVVGPVHITNNYMNLEEESSLPAEFEKVWHETFVIFFLGSKGDALISQNIIKNGTARDINPLDLTGKVSVKGNEIEIGPLSSLTFSSVPPYLFKSRHCGSLQIFLFRIPSDRGRGLHCRKHRNQQLPFNGCRWNPGIRCK